MSRPLTDFEVAMARSVFGDAVDYGRVRLANLIIGKFAVTLGSLVVFPAYAPIPEDFTEESVWTQAWLMHELTHVWQFQTRPLWTLLSWAGVFLTGGYGRGLPGYRYAWPPPAWERLNLEQQAAMVEHAFSLRESGRCKSAPAGAHLGAYRACIPLDF